MMTAECLMVNCRNKAPDDEAFCAKHRASAMTANNPKQPIEYGRIHTDGSRSGGQPPKQPEVTEEDREAVAAFHKQSFKALLGTTDAEIDAGINRAHTLLCQAFAAHRIAAERAAIEADRRGRTFSPTELDQARAEGRGEGLEEAARVFEEKASFFRDNAVKQNARVGPLAKACDYAAEVLRAMKEEPK